MGRFRMIACAGASLLALASAQVAQGQAFDRRSVLAPGAVTSDDPRHVPAPPPRGPAAILVLRGGRIFDAVDGRVRDGTLVIERNRIQAILPPGRSDWPASATVLDVDGATVMPGLIDMHVHVTYPEEDTPIDEQASEGSGVLRGLVHLQRHLQGGITSVRDMGGVLNAPFLLSEWMAQNRAPGPRMFAAGHIITGTGGHAADRPIAPIHSPAFTHEADGPDAWRHEVREMFKNGASVIKIASHFSPAEVQAAIDEAHMLGLRVTCDCETIYTQMAVAAGIDMIEHPMPRSDETVAEMARRHIASIPTMQVYQNLYDTRGGYYGATSRRFSQDQASNWAMLKKLKAAGVTLGVGTDTVGAGNQYTPNMYVAELRWLVKAGYAPAEALRAATQTNARLLDMQDKLGTLEPGKLADVIVVHGRPDVDVDALLKLDWVIRDGIVEVDHGRLVTPAFVPAPLPKPSPPADLH